MTGNEDVKLGRRFEKFFNEKSKRGKEEVEERRTAEAKSQLPIDGRISSTVDIKGLVQLNVRVPKDVKDMILEERDRRRENGRANSDNGDIVVEALRAYLAQGK